MYRNACPICDRTDADVEALGALNRRIAVECPTCGTCQLTDALADRLEDENYLPDRHVISLVTREAMARGEVLKLNVNNVKELMQTATLPQSPTEKMARILAYMLRESDRFGAVVELDADSSYPIAGACDADEFARLVAELVEEGLCEEHDSGDEGYFLTATGWERAQGVRAPAAGTPQAFVAMWFADEMDDAYELGFAPALEQCGYRPLCVKYEDYNEKIDEFIDEQIKNSGLIVADFTGQRQCVYYEVGLAVGKEIPVVWTCRVDEIDNCHFDTRQYNHVAWSSPRDLRAKLVQRIKGSGLAKS